MHGIAGVLLAAGRGRRIGQPKALLRWGSETFASRMARTWSAVCDPVILVAGAKFREVKEQLTPPAVAVFNPKFEGPMLASVQVGLGAVPASAAGALVGPIDQPLLDAGLLREVAAAFADAPDRIVVPVHGGTPGHPIALPRHLFDEIAAEPDWSSLERILERHADDIIRLDLPARPEVLRNINTPEEYRAFMTAAIRDEQSAL